MCVHVHLYKIFSSDTNDYSDSSGVFSSTNNFQDQQVVVQGEGDNIIINSTSPCSDSDSIDNKNDTSLTDVSLTSISDAQVADLLSNDGWDFSTVVHSATVHDIRTDKIAWFTHQTKTGIGSNWIGTSNGAEGDMLHSILEDVKVSG